MENFDEKTAFNMGLATLERMNNLLIDLHEFNLSQNIGAIKGVLFEIYKEVFPFLKKNEKHDGNELWYDIEDFTINQIDANTIEYDNRLYDELNNFDFWLRDMMNKKGLLMSKGDNPNTAL